MRDNQQHGENVIAFFTQKPGQEELITLDFIRLRDGIVKFLAQEAPEAVIGINMDQYLKGVYICEDMDSFVLLERATSNMRVVSEPFKLTIEDEKTDFIFYAMLPVAAPENLLTYVIPKSNGDLDTAHWKIVRTNGSHVILQTDLLGACVLHNMHFALRYNDTEFDLALLIANN